MDITTSNFHQELEAIVDSIKSCDFIAVDGEFTGLDVSDSGHTAPFDTPEERYQKIRLGCTDFLLVQLGVCTFHLDVKKQKYVARPYNFYIFPRPHGRQGPDRRFLCQSSSMDFLISQGFDFNKLFKEGIGYLPPAAAAALRQQLEEKHAAQAAAAATATPAQAKMAVPADQKPFLAGVYEKIDKYLESEEKEPLSLPPCNAFQRRLIYQTVEEKYQDIFMETVTGEKKERYILVSRLKNKDDRLKKEQDKQAAEKLQLEAQVGFTNVIQAISESAKLVVGHNMFLDVIHCINQFHSFLPPDIDDFKDLTKTVFPRLLDTKLMVNTPPLKEHFLSTSLEEVKITVSQPPFYDVKIELDEGFDKYADGGALHEAGYDAFVTGANFVHLTRFLGTFQEPKDDFLLPTSNAVEPFVNKLHLMRIYDIPYLNLDGPDLPVQRDHVFHATFPKEWRSSDLYTLFDPFGTIQISWLTDTSAYVGLHKRENSEKALKYFSKRNEHYQVVSYKAFHQAQAYKWASQDYKVSNKRKIDDQSSDGLPSKVQHLSADAKNSASADKKDESSKQDNKLFEEFDKW